jgi:hypothetical protein
MLDFHSLNLKPLSLTFTITKAKAVDHQMLYYSLILIDFNEIHQFN